MGDPKRLLVRVGTGSGVASGRLMDIEDFVARAEAIEARRPHRPNPIAGETVEPSVTSPRSAEPLDPVNPPSPSLHSLLAEKPQILPWKNLFKAHWDSR